MTQPDWDDERLDAAFHARFDRPAPTDLARDVHLRIAGASPARFGGLRVARAWTYAAAAVVVVLVAGTALVGLGGLGRSGGSPLPSDASSAATGPSATPTEQALPGVIFEQLPVISVTDAIAVRDAGVDDREIAVHGWFADSGIPACPAPVVNPVSPLQVGCPDGFIWLMEQAESLRDQSGNQTSITSPTGPALNPDLDGLDRSWEPAAFMPGTDGASTPVDVVFVGHFDDRRAELCPQDEIDACRDKFVVNSVARVRGVEPPISVLREAQGAVSSDHEIAAVVADEAPGSPILSATVVDTNGIVTLEPSLGPIVQGMVDHPKLWVVRVLESERVSTYIVIDGSDAIYEMNPEGEAILVGGTPPTPVATASPSAWPPTGSRVITLTSEVGAGKPPVEVAVVDQSGRLAGTSEKGDVDPATTSFDGQFGAYAEPGHPGRIHLSWVGGICDSRITVTVTPDLGSISFDMGPQPDCDSMGVGRELVLDFTGDVDVPAIQVGEITAVPSAAPSEGTGYELDCGPLGPDTCQKRADEIVADNRVQNPSRRVVSIILTDKCGSYTATFDDGSGVAASADCVQP